MTRVPVSALGGGALALLLFWLLALLVSPPEKEIEVLEMAMTLSAVDMPDVVQEEAAEPQAEPPPPALPEPVAPPPMPEPAPPLESPIALPEPELPPEMVEPLEFDDTLPELTEAVPEPQPRPEPTPEPRPEPRPEPVAQPSPQPTPAPTETTESTSSSSPTRADATPQTPVDVGQITPTNRVPPTYPSRAQRRGLEGYVELEFVIRLDGSVDPSTIRVVGAQPRNTFDDAARQSVSRWQFEPADRLRRARQRLEFQLR